MKYTLITGASQGMGLLMAKKWATLKEMFYSFLYLTKT